MGIVLTLIFTMGRIIRQNYIKFERKYLGDGKLRNSGRFGPLKPIFVQNIVFLERNFSSFGSSAGGQIFNIDSQGRHFRVSM